VTFNGIQNEAKLKVDLMVKNKTALTARMSSMTSLLISSIDYRGVLAKLRSKINEASQLGGFYRWKVVT
jgi:hypothetical protein